MDFAAEILLGISLLLNAYFFRLHVRAQTSTNASIQELAKDNSRNIHELIEMHMIGAKERHTYQRLAEQKFTTDLQERMRQPTSDVDEQIPEEELFEEMSMGNRRAQQAYQNYQPSEEELKMPAG